MLQTEKLGCGVLRAAVAASGLIARLFASTRHSIELDIIRVRLGTAQINETALNSSLTVKTELPPGELTTLVAWLNITGLEYASGISVYNTTASLSKSSDVHVLLSIGAVDGTYGIKINDVTLNYVDQFLNAPVDITSYIVDGKNGASWSYSSFQMRLSSPTLAYLS
jgi:hypothetical protein